MEITKNLDKIILQKREELFLKLKKDKFIQTYLKYLKNIIQLNPNEKQLNKQFENGELQILYDINKSITQSLRANAGLNFEKCIEEILSEYHISYAKQVFITNDGQILEKLKKNLKGHKVDFMVPTPLFGTCIKNYKGFIISCKTTLRERYLQDKFLGNFCLISLEKIKQEGIKSVQICEKRQEFTKLIKEFISQGYIIYPTNKAPSGKQTSQEQHFPIEQ